MTMTPEVEHGDYYEVEDTNGQSFVIPADVVGKANPIAADFDPYMTEGFGEFASATLKTGWFGRLTMPGYLDCTDWETADTEAELLESLRGDHETDIPDGW